MISQIVNPLFQYNHHIENIEAVKINKQSYNLYSCTIL